MALKVDIRVPVGLPVPETADFIAGCEAAGFSGVESTTISTAAGTCFSRWLWPRSALQE